MAITNQLEGLDTITLKGNITPKAMDVRTGSTINEEVSFSTYANADYYWTIEFTQTTSSGYNQNIVYSALMGRIEYDYF